MAVNKGLTVDAELVREAEGFLQELGEKECELQDSAVYWLNELKLLTSPE